MKLMIDTNIFLDVLGRRSEFYDASSAVLALCEEGKIEGFISASSVTDLFYLSHRVLHDKDKTYQVMENILKIVKVLTVTNDDVLTAFNMRTNDFEDCLMATCAKNNRCKGIVTRNGKDFSDFDIKIYTPDEIIGRKCKNHDINN